MPAGQYPRKKRIPVCHPDKSHYGKGMCKNCYARQQARAWRETHQEQYKSQEYYRKLHKRYGVTTDAFQELLAKQGGKCALCDEFGYKQKSPVDVAYFSLVIDHDHNTGKVRGLLCQRCNIALGGYEIMKDNLNLPKYLEDSVED